MLSNGNDKGNIEAAVVLSRSTSLARVSCLVDQ